MAVLLVYTLLHIVINISPKNDVLKPSTIMAETNISIVITTVCNGASQNITND